MKDQNVRIESMYVCINAIRALKLVRDIGKEMRVNRDSSINQQPTENRHDHCSRSNNITMRQCDRQCYISSHLRVGYQVQ